MIITYLHNLSNSADISAIQRWRDKIKVDFLVHKRETYKWLSREYSCSQTFLRKADTFTVLTPRKSIR